MQVEIIDAPEGMIRARFSGGSLWWRWERVAVAAVGRSGLPGQVFWEDGMTHAGDGVWLAVFREMERRDLGAEIVRARENLRRAMGQEANP